MIDSLDWGKAHDELVRRTFTRDNLRHLQRREEEVEALGESREGWEKRQEYVRAALRKAIGPLPTERTPLNAKVCTCTRARIRYTHTHART